MKKLLIKILVVVALFVSVPASADVIDDCIKCPGLQAIFDRLYHWEYIV